MEGKVVLRKDRFMTPAAQNPLPCPLPAVNSLGNIRQKFENKNLLQEEREYVNSLLVLYMSTVRPFLG
jgi:hypothetical protein